MKLTIAEILAKKKLEAINAESTQKAETKLTDRLSSLKKEVSPTVLSVPVEQVTQAQVQVTAPTVGQQSIRDKLNSISQQHPTGVATVTGTTQTADTKEETKEAKEAFKLSFLARLKANAQAMEAKKPLPTPITTVVNENAAINAAVQMTAIERLRAKLALAAQKESVLATVTGHNDGTLPVDEEIVCNVDIVSHEEVASNVDSTGSALGMSGETIIYNKQQERAVYLGGTGESFVLIGAAGTGKTTCSKGSINAIVSNHKTGILQAEGHKHLVNGTPGIIIISYTRRAVNNIRKVQSKEMQNNCITSHKLLEYEPQYFEVEDPTTGTTKRTMQFLPARNASNCLPSSITTIVVEEASMLSLDLYSQITAAISHEVQWIFIGDIQQLPPVFGSAILGFKMLELEVVELTEVYRQALESPIIKLAHRILSGVPIPVSEYKSWETAEKLVIHPWKKKLTAEDACRTLAAFFKAAYTNKGYDPEEDIILIPYNKACGANELNRHIANFLARQRDEITYEIMAGYNKHYFSVGDRILYDKEDAIIVEIERNAAYAGKRVQTASRALDYWGCNQDKSQNVQDDDDFGIDIDAILEAVSDVDDRVTQSSHTLTLRLDNSGSEIRVSKAAEINNILLGYAITVHKAQGSEWRKVFFCLHHSHATMLQRELLYTGVTRAREMLYCICEPESFTKGILGQKIKGNTLAEKAEFFKGKVAEGGYTNDEE